MLKRITKRHLIGGGIALVIIVVAFAVIWGAWRDSRSQKQILLETDTALELYNHAVDRLQAQEHIYYQAEGSISFSIEANTLEENFTQLITMNDRGTEHPRVCVEETSIIGDYSIKRFDFYSDGNEYVTVQGSSFQSPMTLEDYLAKFTPSVLLDPMLYTDILGLTVHNESTITFQKPAAVEMWVAPGAELVSADGTAKLDKNGTLISSTYIAVYKLDGVTYSVHYHVTITEGEVPLIQLPETSVYTPTDAIDAPFMLEKGCGYLMSVGSINAQYEDAITCEAFGDERTQKLQLTTDNDDTWNAQVDTSVTVSNTSKTGTGITTVKKEIFSGNTYSISTDGKAFVNNPDVDLTAMTDYCDNLLIGTIILPQYIAAAEATVVEDIYSISFQTKEEFAQILAEEACTILYQNPSVLTNMSQSSVTDTVTCYLNLNVRTGLPVSSGFYYKGTYTISDIPYSLSYKADQSYSFTDHSSTDSVTTQEENATTQETDSA